MSDIVRIARQNLRSVTFPHEREGNRKRAPDFAFRDSVQRLPLGTTEPAYPNTSLYVICYSDNHGIGDAEAASRIWQVLSSN